MSLCIAYKISSKVLLWLSRRIMASVGLVRSWMTLCRNISFDVLCNILSLANFLQMEVNVSMTADQESHGMVSDIMNCWQSQHNGSSLDCNLTVKVQSCIRGWIHGISPCCPQPSIAFQRRIVAYITIHTSISWITRCWSPVYWQLLFKSHQR